MAPKSITVAQDETFHHGRICLVAIEPVSNFILVEQYADDRGAQSWDAAMVRGLSGLPVEVFQSTSDEASALLRHARTTLGAHHSPDLFHPQQDISRATSLPLGRQAQAAEQAAAEAADEVDRLCDEAEQYAQQQQGPGRPRDYDGRLDRANDDYEQAQADAVEATQRRSRVRQAARGISRAYHPFDLDTGQRREAQQVEVDLTEQFGRIEQVADEAALSDRCRKRLRKAKKLLPQMVATIALVHTLIRDKLQALDLDPELLRAAQDLLVPMHYLKLRLGKAGSAKERDELLGAIARLEDKIGDPGGELAAIEEQLRSLLGRTARGCAELFQRSSSNVEGRNGVLDFAPPQHPPTQPAQARCTDRPSQFLHHPHRRDHGGRTLLRPATPRPVRALAAEHTATEAACGTATGAELSLASRQIPRRMKTDDATPAQDRRRGHYMMGRGRLAVPASLEGQNGARAGIRETTIKAIFSLGHRSANPLLAAALLTPA